MSVWLIVFNDSNHILLYRKSRPSKGSKEVGGFRSSTKDLSQSPSLASTYNPIDVINYFVTVEHENAMAR